MSEASDHIVSRPPATGLKAAVYHVLEAGRANDRATFIFDVSMTTLIIANVAAFAIATVPDISAAYGRELAIFNAFSVFVFTVEYGLRLWVCVEHAPYRRLSPTRARVRFVFTPMMIVDLLAIAPFYLSVFFAADLRIFRIFRLLRFFKMVRYSPALSSLGRVIWRERRALMAALIVMTGALLVSSTLLYFIERHEQPEAFGTVPAAMWWSMATLTTVGYGDVVPITVAGRLVGGLVMLLGLGMFALPIGIIATGFNQEIHRQEFAVTWGMVASVPLFSGLDAKRIVAVMGRLEALRLRRGAYIAQRGDVADAMYFIVSGDVNVVTEKENIILSDGDFFGEMALLRQTPRRNDILAATDCHLLKLSASDFSVLAHHEPALRDAVLTVARGRAGEGADF